MYAEFYNLSKMPFDMLPDPEFHYPSEVHREAIASLIYGILNNKGILTLIGEVGTGKTISVRLLLEHYLLRDFKTVSLNNPRIAPQDLIRNLLKELNVKTNASQSVNERFDLLVLEILQLCEQKQGVLFVIDCQDNQNYCISSNSRGCVSYVNGLPYLHICQPCRTSKLKDILHTVCGLRVPPNYHFMSMRFARLSRLLKVILVL